MALRWRPARDGFVESHDGRWRIVPCYAGCTRAQDYELWHDGQRAGSMYATQHDATQHDAKEHACELWLKIEHAEGKKSCTTT